MACTSGRPPSGSGSSRGDLIHPAAGKILSSAMKAEAEHRYMAAYNLYTEGIQVLFDSIRVINDKDIKNTLQAKARQFIERAEAIKRIVDAEKIKPAGYHEQIVIEDGDRGYGLEKVFSDYLDSQLTEVEIDDPYIRHYHQVQLFIRFCAILMRRAINVKTIRLKTTADPNSDKRKQQISSLEDLKNNLRDHGVTLIITYAETLHDREIRLNNGWVIKIGRGLDYFKRPDGPYCVDNYELDFRACMATTIDIFYKSPNGDATVPNPVGRSGTRPS